MTPGFLDSVIPWLRDFSFFLSNTFIYEPILLKLSMNANIVKMQIFHKIKYDLRGHLRLFDDICLVLTLTYVLMDNFLSLFIYILLSPVSGKYLFD